MIESQLINFFENRTVIVYFFLFFIFKKRAVAVANNVIVGGCGWQDGRGWVGKIEIMGLFHFPFFPHFTIKVEVVFQKMDFDF